MTPWNFVIVILVLTPRRHSPCSGCDHTPRNPQAARLTVATITEGQLWQIDGMHGDMDGLRRMCQTGKQHRRNERARRARCADNKDSSTTHAGGAAPQRQGSSRAGGTVHLSQPRADRTSREIGADGHTVSVARTGTTHASFAWGDTHHLSIILSLFSAPVSSTTLSFGRNAHI